MFFFKVCTKLDKLGQVLKEERQAIVEMSVQFFKICFLQGLISFAIKF